MIERTQTFGNRSALYQEFDRAKPHKWLKRVHHTAKKLKDLLDTQLRFGPRPMLNGLTCGVAFRTGYWIA
jgi:hypothetical protein